MPKRKRSREGFPYDATPDVHHFPGVPRSSFDLVNMYGTYNIQPTSDTENTFPLIAPGLPKRIVAKSTAILSRLEMTLS